MKIFVWPYYKRHQTISTNPWYPVWGPLRNRDQSITQTCSIDTLSREFHMAFSATCPRLRKRVSDNVSGVVVAIVSTLYWPIVPVPRVEYGSATDRDRLALLSACFFFSDDYLVFNFLHRVCWRLYHLGLLRLKVNIRHAKIVSY